MSIDYILEKTPPVELLAGLAEEATELAQAALKMRRVLDGTSPTPTTKEAAFEGLKEEIADVLLFLHLLDLDRQRVEYKKTMQRKIARWTDRLRKKEVPPDGANRSQKLQGPAV